VCGVKRHADARKRGMKRVQIEPHLSVTGACSAEWVPIKPKTDAAFLYACCTCSCTSIGATDVEFLAERPHPISSAEWLLLRMKPANPGLRPAVGPPMFDRPNPPRAEVTAMGRGRRRGLD
jgi:phenylacetyl-CoA:acceptor oxidoreductase